MVVPAVAQARKDFSGIKIVVDPGHGGQDAGALAPNGLTEKNVNLSVSKYLANYLHKARAKVIMTRTADKFIPLPGRVSIANKAKADVFLAVHQNSAANKKSNGTETYFYRPSAAKLAKYVQKELLKAFGFTNRGSRQAAFHVIRRTAMPSILTEASFMSNPRVAKNLKSKEYRQKQALAIFNGLKRQYGVDYELELVKKPAAVKPKLVEKKTEEKIGLVQFTDSKTVNDQVIEPPFAKLKNSYGLFTENVPDKDVVGSIDVFKPPVDITSGLSAGLVAE